MFEPGDDGSVGGGAEPDAVPFAEWELGAADEGWLVSYADMLSVILAMVVLLLGRMVMAGAASEQVRADALPVARAVVAVANAPEANALDVDDLLVPSPAVSAPIANASEVSLSLRNLPDMELLLAPAAAEPRAPGAGPSREQRLAELVEARFAGAVAAQPQDTGVLLTIADVALFGSASAELAPPATQLLTELATTLREAGEVEVSVEGHTDDRPIQGGRFASNWDLAAARANAVTRFLLAQGFERSRVHSVSYADTRPVADNGTVAGRAANRRVELRIEFLGNAASS